MKTTCEWCLAEIEIDEAHEHSARCKLWEKVKERSGIVEVDDED